ncbi:MAG TPA: hypothetical protein DEH78_18225, partial [Solibacterales bacterium]|nr:hypothetical protein [Bryobacterales bacterium]
GGGAGGGIHLIAPVISGAGTTSAVGGSSSFSGGPGRIRLDATTFTYTGSASPQPARGAPFNPPLPTNYPSVRVVSVGGVSVPLSPNNSFVVPDVLLNSASAVPVAVQASNIPVGTVVTLVLTPEIGGP